MEMMEVCDEGASVSAVDCVTHAIVGLHITHHTPRYCHKCRVTIKVM